MDGWMESLVVEPMACHKLQFDIIGMGSYNKSCKTI